uniref:MLLT10 histone lysine methyltransferase DOT1L cofactor n=1 Tax=Oncorhynchus mykiss TaxID=8022 RepID=A0A8L0DK56_ONCMY
MVSGELCLAADNDFLANNMKEMIGGCCVCSDERGWAENPLVYCDGHGCNVAVHQACYGIVQVPTGPWFCRKCESQERAARVRCELCPHKDGALKRTDNGGWAHVVCALYIPEVEFANVSTMEPIVLQSVPHDRYNKKCYICEDQGRESKAATGACMTCNKHGCRQAFHVTCAQFAGLLCEEQGSDADNVKYCGYCKYHYSKLKHKERERHKPKHKKTLELSPSLASTLMLASDKSYNSSSSSGGVVSAMPAASQKRLDDSAARFTTANFQEVPVHSGGLKDSPPTGSEGKPGSEVKQGKKSISQGIGVQRGRKSLTPGKPLPSAVVTTATSSTAASSTGTFHQGAFSSCDVSSGVGPAPMSGANSELQQPMASLAPPSPFTATAPMINTVSPHVSGLPGPVFNMAPSHMFGNRLNPNSAMAALIAQSQASPADQEVGDGNSIAAPGFSRRASPKTTLCPRSPLGGLQIRYDPGGSLGSGLGGLGSGQGGGDTVPPVATSIEQLLERQWSDGQQFLLQQGAQGDVLGMLKSLHQLQQENRRLEDQIKTLTMKKERLQLLSAQLSVPFTPTTAAQDVKSDSSLPIPAQDSVSCGRSSGGSTSSLSTPPSVSHSPPQPHQLNGVAMGTMMLGGGAGPGMGGIVGVLNGVIQTTSSPHTYTHTSAPGTSAALPISSSINNSSVTAKSRLGALSEQQRLLLHQHQLQQLLSSQPSAEQQQVLFYQLMQQQQDLHQLQSLSTSQLPSIPLSSTQLPITSLLSSSHVHGQGTITANPFLALHTHSHPDTHTHATAQKPRLAEKAVGLTGQEKT